MKPLEFTNRSKKQPHLDNRIYLDDIFNYLGYDVERFKQLVDIPNAMATTSTGITINLEAISAEETARIKEIKYDLKRKLKAGMTV